MSKPKTGYPIADKSFSADLKYWRAERPDEYVMDRFIREALRLEFVEKGLDECTQKWAETLDAQAKEIERLRERIAELEDGIKKAIMAYQNKRYDILLDTIAGAKSDE